jgi:hypothetical protein
LWQYEGYKIAGQIKKGQGRRYTMQRLSWSIHGYGRNGYAPFAYHLEAVGTGILLNVFSQKERIGFAASKEFGASFLQVSLAFSSQDTGCNE